MKINWNTYLNPGRSSERADRRPCGEVRPICAESASLRSAYRKWKNEAALLEPPRVSGPAAIEPAPLESLPLYPVVILGSGVSGLMAATYLGQAGYAPLVLEGPNPGGAIMQSDHVRNWPGVLDIKGAELIENMHRQAETSGARFEMNRVIAVDDSKRPLVLTVEDLFGGIQKIRTHSLVVAMGTTPNFLGVPGEETYWTKGVYNCALCDGPLYKGKSVAVVGGANSAIVEALYLSHIAEKVTILMRGAELKSLDEAMKKELLSRPNVEIRALTTVESLEGDEESLTHVNIKTVGGTERLKIDALFLAIGSTPNTKLFKDQLALDERGYLITNPNKETSAKGIFAIGDITPTKCKQAVCAAGDAAEASIYISQYLAEINHYTQRGSKFGNLAKPAPGIFIRPQAGARGGPY